MSEEAVLETEKSSTSSRAHSSIHLSRSLALSPYRPSVDAKQLWTSSDSSRPNNSRPPHDHHHRQSNRVRRRRRGLVPVRLETKFRADLAHRGEERPHCPTTDKLCLDRMSSSYCTPPYSRIKQQQLTTGNVCPAALVPSPPADHLHQSIRSHPHGRCTGRVGPPCAANVPDAASDP